MNFCFVFKDKIAVTYQQLTRSIFSNRSTEYDLLRVSGIALARNIVLLFVLTLSCQLFQYILNLVRSSFSNAMRSFHAAHSWQRRFRHIAVRQLKVIAFLRKCELGFLNFVPSQRNYEETTGFSKLERSL